MRHTHSPQGGITYNYTFFRLSIFKFFLSRSQKHSTAAFEMYIVYMLRIHTQSHAHAFLKLNTRVPTYIYMNICIVVLRCT